MGVPMKLAVLVAVAAVPALGGFTNRKGKTTLVLAAPSVWDEYYRPKFFDIIRFQIAFAKMVMKKDNVVILADKHTLPYLDGRSHKMKEKLPKDALLQADIYDINVRNFAPVGIRRKIKFTYGPRRLPPMVAKQMDKSMQLFLKRHDFKPIKEELDVLVDASDIVHNGKDKAVLAKELLEANEGRLPDWAVTIKLLNAFKSVAILPTPSNSSMSDPDMTTSLADLMAFVDEKHLVVSELSDEDKAEADAVLWKKFRQRVKIVQLPTHYTKDGWRSRSGVCGLHTSLVSTKRHLYVPVFGNDPANWDSGHSSMMDKMVLELIQVNAGPTKTVVPINVPKAICEAGIGLRSLVWQLDGKRDGKMADKIIHLARYHGRRRLRA